MKFKWTDEEREAWRPPEKLTVSEWADKYRVLVPQTSAEPGPWRTSRTPYLQAIMDAFSSSYIEKIVVECGSQLGKTEVLYNCLGYIIHHDPAPTLLVMPTIDLARYVSRNRIQPMINAADPLRERKPLNDDHFALLEMNFPGMVLSLAGANSAASLASRPCRYIFLDEVNKYPKFTTGEESDPISLATERQKTFWNKKTFIVSTPTSEDGQITRERKSCDIKMSCYVPCPECGAYQVLKLENILKPDGLDPYSPTYIQEIRESAYYKCPECEAIIEDYQKPAMLAACDWQPESKPPMTVRTIGFHLSSLYSPWLTWGDILSKFFASKDYPDKLQNFLNSWLAQAWVDTLHYAEEKDILDHKTELPPLVVPKEAVALIAGVDVQKAGFYYVIRAWARDYTSWLIRYGYIMSWDDLNQIIFEDKYPIQGAEDDYMMVFRAAIDTGGSEGGEVGISSTEEVYSWIRKNGKGVVFGIKGASITMGRRVKQSIIDYMPGRTKRPIPGGLILFHINTDAFKEIIHYRLQVEDDAAQSFYLHSETDMDYARQITAEEKRRNKKGQVEWHQTRTDNHYLDCEVYCAAAADVEFMGGLRILPDRAKPKEHAPRPKSAKGGDWISRNGGSWIKGR